MDVKITEYADRLIDDLDTVDYIDRVKPTDQLDRPFPWNGSGV